MDTFIDKSVFVAKNKINTIFTQNDSQIFRNTNSMYAKTLCYTQFGEIFNEIITLSQAIIR